MVRVIETRVAPLYKNRISSRSRAIRLSLPFPTSVASCEQLRIRTNIDELHDDFEYLATHNSSLHSPTSIIILVGKAGRKSLFEHHYLE